MSLRQIRGSVVTLTLVALVALVFGVVPSSRAIQIYLVLVLALATYGAVSATLRRFERPQPLRRRVRPRLRRVRTLPAYFERVVRSIELASATAGGYEPLRRRLSVIAEQRLAGHGVTLDDDRARGLLGDDAWALLQQGAHEERFASGPRPAQLRQLLDAVERL
jgi:hypothetical protein